MAVRSMLQADLRWYQPLSRFWTVNAALRCMASPGFLAVVLIRVQEAVHRRSPGAAILIRSLNAILTGVEWHANTPTGPGLHLPHPNGVVVGTGALIGDGVTLFQHVTVGKVSLLDDSDNRWPTLADGCVIAAGACVLGDVTVGRGARVGANAVLTQDLAEGATFAPWVRTTSHDAT